MSDVIPLLQTLPFDHSRPEAKALHQLLYRNFRRAKEIDALKGELDRSMEEASERGEAVRVS